MKKTFTLLLATICLGMFGCANAPDQAAERKAPDRDSPPGAQEYWAKRDAQDRAERASERARNIKP